MPYFLATEQQGEVFFDFLCETEAEIIKLDYATKNENNPIVLKQGVLFLEERPTLNEWGYGFKLNDTKTALVPLTEEELETKKIPFAKQKKINEILDYDSSDAINSFTINGVVPMWLSKEDRINLASRFEVEKTAGISTTSIFYEGLKLDLDIPMAQLLLQQLNLYAIQCYDNTQKHIHNVQQLSSLSAIEAYDYKKNYPQKLNFTLSI